MVKIEVSNALNNVDGFSSAFKGSDPVDESTAGFVKHDYMPHQTQCNRRASPPFDVYEITLLMSEEL